MGALLIRRVAGAVLLLAALLPPWVLAVEGASPPAGLNGLGVARDLVVYLLIGGCALALVVAWVIKERIGRGVLAHRRGYAWDVALILGMAGVFALVLAAWQAQASGRMFPEFSGAHRYDRLLPGIWLALVCLIAAVAIRLAPARPRR